MARVLLQLRDEFDELAEIGRMLSEIGHGYPDALDAHEALGVLSVVHNQFERLDEWMQRVRSYDAVLASG